MSYHPTIRALLLDFGNVIEPFSFDRFIDRCALFSPLSPVELCAQLFNTGLHARFERGEIGPAAFFAAYAKNIALDTTRITYAMFARWWCDIFLPSNSLMLDQLLAHVDQRKVAIGLVSNTNAILYERSMHMHPIVHRHIPYRQRTLSHKVGAMKPDRAIYDDAVTRCHATYGEALLVDDMPENVAAFQLLGGHGIIWNTSTQTIGALERRLDAYGIFAS